MLRALEIRDILIIDHLELSFQPGLNVLTGETGAGKSILLDSLGFVLGWRGRAELVRQGAAQGEVAAEFDLPDAHPARDILADSGLPIGDELILRRINTRDGRKTAWVNDRRCSGEVLRQLSDVLVELHGQQDDRGLLNPRGHRDLLDVYGAYALEKDVVRAAWRGRRTAKAALEEARVKHEEMQAEEEFLRHAVSELDSLDPLEGEDEQLDQRRRLMQGAERVREDVSKARTALGSEGAEGAANDALRWLEGAAEKTGDLLDEPIAALSSALAEMDEAASGVNRALEQLSFDPHELETVEERLFAIRALARKHGVTPDGLAVYADELRQKLHALESGDADIRALEVAEAEADAAYEHAAGVLSEARIEAASRLDKAVSAELAPLKMERAVFTTVVEQGDPGPEGCDAVTFCVATNPGAPAGPLNKIASGGELSRFLLALKVCLTGMSGSRAMIFDEIDRGVGGATADAVGRRLAQIAALGQVLVVTHSPQVAARAAHHWRVEKRVSGEETISTVTPLSTEDRVDEIARMLSGDRVTNEARAAAEALMAG